MRSSSRAFTTSNPADLALPVVRITISRFGGHVRGGDERTKVRWQVTHDGGGDDGRHRLEDPDDDVAGCETEEERTV
jgi:hypothetical protein